MSTTYTTKQGDMFDSLAFLFYKDEKYTKELMDANKTYLSTVVFSAGVVLVIPDIDTTSSADAASLPPWRI